MLARQGAQAEEPVSSEKQTGRPGPAPEPVSSEEHRSRAEEPVSSSSFLSVCLSVIYYTNTQAQAQAYKHSG